MKAVFALALCVILFLSVVSAQFFDSSPESNESGQRCVAGKTWTTNVNNYCQSCICSVRGFSTCTDVPCAV